MYKIEIYLFSKYFYILDLINVWRSKFNFHELYNTLLSLSAGVNMISHIKYINLEFYRVWILLNHS